MDKKGVCKYCGSEFIQPTRGRRKDYCNKGECIRKAKGDAQKKWYAKKMETLKGTKNRIVEQKEKKVVYSSTDKALNTLENEDFTDIIQIARELGAIRFKIVEALKKCSPEQSVCDKENQKFLHDVENLAQKDEVYVEDVLELFVKQIDKRQNRRFVKDRQAMLKHLLTGIDINPSAYVMNYIKKRDTRIYTPTIKEKSIETIKR